ncbi:MAG: citramalate synthase [Puniceicoccales bacterium]|jgi:2-isopropylmalate synthase|nr:citramalate synthase [Puniceicoccales bacterium]
MSTTASTENPRVSIYDTTLRDGAQGEGISFADSGKILFAHLLDDFGVDFIEGGFAGSNPRDRKFFSQIRMEKLRHAKITAFGSTRRADLDASDDPQLAGLLAAGTEHVTIFGKSSLLQAREVLRVTPEANLQIVADSVGFLSQTHHRVVFFDAEHFFDAYKESAAYALSVLRAAHAHGAAALVLCDTNGGTLPHEIHAITTAVRAEFPGVQIGIHAHNDAGLAAANSLEAVRAGATQVQGTINGYGERTGNADLITIMPSLELKLGRHAIGSGSLRGLRTLSTRVADLANQKPDRRQPYVGRDAFCHKAGAHVNAVAKSPATYEHIDPALVGNQRHILVSELAGAANIQLKASELGLCTANAGRDQLRVALDAVKSRENEGYSYESADGSFKVLFQRALEGSPPKVQLDSFRVIVEKRESGGRTVSEATVKVRVNTGGEEVMHHTVGEGDGPVDALHAALVAALERTHPGAAGIQLTDYRVRILNPEAATRATTRVLIESGDGSAHWSTVGVSTNIIEASVQALLDGIEHKLRFP